LKLSKIPTRRVLLAFVTIAAGCLIAACGSASSSSSTGSAGATGSSTTTSASTGAGGGANSARRTALVACLKQHGVTLPNRPAGAPPAGAGTGTGTTGTGTTPRRGFFGSGGFAANPKLRAAFQACGANFGFRGGGGFAGRLSHTTITKYVTCVRQHGYDLPNPNFSGKGPIFPANIRTNPKFVTASKACQSILVPPGGGGSGGGSSTTSGA
jgi:hypothetical protein